MLRVANLQKWFTTDEGRVHAVDDVSFELKVGEFFTLLGPSGCGKSTTLRCVAGLESVDGGEIAIDGEVVASRSLSLPPDERPIAMVFQSYAIWPHMTVMGNITFPLRFRGGSATSRRRGLPRRKRRERGMEALKLVQLDHLADRRAPYLSGGQQQRVALARALVVGPKLLLLDEPLSNLDAKLREEMRFEIKELTAKLGISTIYVTHDQGEALSMSDRIAVMSDGKIRQLGAPRDIYLTPVTGQVARIVGSVNLLAGHLVRRDADFAEVKTASEQLLHCRAESSLGVGDSCDVMFRPELVGLRPAGAGTNAQRVSVVPATVKAVVFAGDHLQCFCETADGPVTAKLPPNHQVESGSNVELVLDADACIAS